MTESKPYAHPIFKVYDTRRKEFFIIDIYTFLLGSGEGHQIIDKWKYEDVIDEHLIWLKDTGFIDVEGRKIFEGDIVKRIGQYSEIDILEYEVKWDKGEFSIGKLPLYVCDNLLVIGNIYGA